ncbi:MAG TPA: aminotransferase class V-fold PLP-dependent enzyme [Solirubrobacteraceae bacterium]|jgi:selenocysteine lyase/cysteine desulfurase|nr:aminotransferase class V-fold PLP-dependent enzyme [Solirubrobacteraceae bacterium]
MAIPLPHSASATTNRQPLAELADSVTEVPLVDGRHTRFISFDYAASAPPLKSVQRVVTDTMAHYASIHRGQSYLSRLSTAAYERARATVSELTGARADDVTIFTRNTTDALNLLQSATPGRVVHFDFEHHANLLPWRRGVSTPIPAAASVGGSLAALELELEHEQAALVTVTGASNVTGECLPLPAVAQIAHRYGARLAVDGAQLAPHRPIDLAGAGIDYLACSGHKLYAPYGGGALIGRRDWLDAARPHQFGGGAVQSVTLADVEWKPSPARHEGGTPNLVGAVSLGAAFEALHAIGFDTIREHELTLYRQLLDGLDRLGIAPLRLWPELRDLVGVASFNVPGYRADLVAAYLSAEHGIGVRGGKFCAHPLLQRFGLGDGGAVRVSIGLGTGSADVAALLHALDRLISDGPAWEYAAVDGYISPVPDRRPSLDEVLAASPILP